MRLRDFVEVDVGKNGVVSLEGSCCMEDRALYSECCLIQGSGPTHAALSFSVHEENVTWPAKSQWRFPKCIGKVTKGKPCFCVCSFISSMGEKKMGALIEVCCRRRSGVAWHASSRPARVKEPCWTPAATHGSETALCEAKTYAPNLCIPILAIGTARRNL